MSRILSRAFSMTSRKASCASTTSTTTLSKTESEHKEPKKKVRFDENVVVHELPYELRFERFAPWKAAPMHDELWDGELMKFRDPELTLIEFMLLYHPPGSRKPKRKNTLDKIKRISTNFSRMIQSINLNAVAKYTNKREEEGIADESPEEDAGTEAPADADDQSETEWDESLNNYFSRLDRMDGVNHSRQTRIRSKSTSMNEDEIMKALLCADPKINKDYAKHQAHYMARIVEEIAIQVPQKY